MAQLVPCSFFARGFCKYGDNCRFYHGSGGAVLPQEEGTAASRGPVNTFILQGPVPVVPDSHGTQPFGSSTSSTGSFPTSYPHEDQNFAVMKSIAADMAEWELFSWQFTTYGPIPSRRSIPGIDDLSPEEVRYSFLSNGNQFPPHLNLEMRLKQIQEFRRDWSHPHLTPQHINLINSLLERPVPQESRSNINNENFGKSGAAPNPITFHAANPQQISQGATTLSSFNFVAPNPSTATTMEVLSASTSPGGFWALPNTGVKSEPQPKPEQTRSAFSSFNFKVGDTQSVPLLPSLLTPTNSTLGNMKMLSSTQRQQTTLGIGRLRDASAWSPNDDMIYSREEDLDPKDIVQFEANQFNQVPLRPPPKRLC